MKIKDIINITGDISARIRGLLFPAATLGLLLIMLGGCTKEPAGGGAPGGEVRFTLAMPQTRALAAADENEVRRVDVLVFAADGGKYHGRQTRTESQIGPDPSDASNIRKKSFTVPLQQGRFDLMILANAGDELGSISLNGATKAEAREIIRATLGASGKWVANPAIGSGYRPIPMWGDVGTLTIDENTNFTGNKSVTMTRMLARVDVQVSGAAAVNFQLKSVRLYNYNTRGCLVPAAAAWDAADKKAKTPTVPSSSVLTKGPVVYDGTQVVASDACAGEIYLFEAENLNGATPKGREQRTCLVVGGKWDEHGNGFDDDPLAYYRVDFSTGMGAGETFLDVLRNHHYTFDITKVAEKGYDDPDDAFRGTSRLTAKVTPWNLAQQNVSDDGQYYLKVNRGSLDFYKEGGRATLTIKSNYDQTNPPSGVAGSYLDLAGIEGWATVDDIGQTISGNEYIREIEITAAPFEGAADRTPTSFQVRAGNLSYIFHLTQSKDPWLMADPEDYYLLIGKTYNFDVHSNRPWSVEIKAGTNDPENGNSRITSLLIREGSPGTAPLHFTTINNNVWPRLVSDGTATLVFSDPEGIMNDKEVVVNMRFASALLFARSNIVLSTDGNGQPILTFAETEADNISIPSNALGLHFLWGSLVGMNSYYDATVYSRPIDPNPASFFVPAEYTGTTSFMLWADLPRHTGSSLDDKTLDDFKGTYGATGYDAAAGKGDICRYISDKGWVQGRWRIPTNYELTRLIAESPVKTPAGTGFYGVPVGLYAYQQVNRLDGLEKIHSGWWFGKGVTENTPVTENIEKPSEMAVFFPATGHFADYGPGFVQVVGMGYQAWYLTSSPAAGAGLGYRPDLGYAMIFAASFHGPQNPISNDQSAATIRCIRDL